MAPSSVLLKTVLLLHTSSVADNLVFKILFLESTWYARSLVVGWGQDRHTSLPILAGSDKVGVAQKSHYLVILLSGQWSKYLVAKFIQNNLFHCWGLYFTCNKRRRTALAWR